MTDKERVHLGKKNSSLFIALIFLLRKNDSVISSQ